MTSRARRFGLRVVTPVDLQGWRVLEIDASVPLTAVPACPADGSAMRPLCTFLDGTTRVRVRVGCCAQCGHLSYIDRPTAAWMNHFRVTRIDVLLPTDTNGPLQTARSKAGSKPR